MIPFGDDISAKSFTDTDFVGERALVSNGSKQLVESATTATQIGYLSTLTGNAQDQLNTKPHANDVNIGETFDHGTFDPLANRFTNFNTRGGVRTMNALGPFSGAKLWYNVVDVRHRNGQADGATGWGGEMVWGMTGSQHRMAFRSRNSDGIPTSWTEVWTKAEISDANMPRLNGENTWTGTNWYIDSQTFRTASMVNQNIAGGSSFSYSGLFVNQYGSNSRKYVGLYGGYSSDFQTVALGAYDSVGNLLSGYVVKSQNATSPPVTELLNLNLLTLASPPSTNIDGGGYISVNGTFVLPEPDIGRLIICSSSPSFGDASSASLQVPAGCRLTGVSNTGATINLAAGGVLSIFGRAVQLFGHSATEWRILGAF
jgi:hypothetical protein